MSVSRRMQALLDGRVSVLAGGASVDELNLGPEVTQWMPQHGGLDEGDHPSDDSPHELQLTPEREAALRAVYEQQRRERNEAKAARRAEKRVAQTAAAHAGTVASGPSF